MGLPRAVSRVGMFRSIEIRSALTAPVRSGVWSMW
jgi:hypothetical protein